ncbi:MarR family transcriptional regulator [candidate division KSB1 bacterium]|nr:MarR family transcriptional regulator [candidate division KSB1 bacterium]
MNQSQKLSEQAERMQRLTQSLLRRYQMRDRNEISCCGVTVSQCYALDVLGEQGEISMVQLARHLFLDKSTATRTIDPLVKRGLVERRFSEQDRRGILVRLTAEGEKLRQEILSGLRASQEHILAQIPEEKRESVLEGLELLSHAVHEWLATCCAPGKVLIPLNRKTEERKLS